MTAGRDGAGEDERAIADGGRQRLAFAEEIDAAGFECSRIKRGARP
jgi:hypothetical protein